MNTAEIFAIDYGTSNTLLGAASKQSSWTDIPIDPEAADPSILKSIILSLGADHWFFGHEAISQYLNQPTQGRVFKSLKKFLPDPVFKGTQVSGQYYLLQDLIAKQLRAIRERACNHIQKDVTSVVLGCPALFSSEASEHQLALDRLKAAAIAAGFCTVEFCPEPIAAAYHFRSQLKSEKIVLVADMGGGTSDFTIVRMGRQRFTSDDVLALGGLSTAGDQYDSDIMYHLISPFFGSKIRYRKPMSSNELGFPKGLIKKISSPADIVFLSRASVMSDLKTARRYLADSGDS